jgi:hypothetical protein
MSAEDWLANGPWHMQTNRHRINANIMERLTEILCQATGAIGNEYFVFP